MSPVVLKSVGTTVAGVLTALASANVYPTLSPLFAAVAGLLAGWLHLPQPVKKAE
jgi:hypothetical protein